MEWRQTLKLLQTSDVQCATENFRSPAAYDYTDELGRSTSREAFIPSISSQIGYNPDVGTVEDLQKRHLGSVVALSGGKDKLLLPRQLTPEMLKRHLGSIVAASATGSKQKQILSQMEKRYLGSVLSKSGFASNSARQRSGSSDESLTKSKRHLGAMAKINSKPFKRTREFDDTESGEISDDLFYDYPVDINNRVDGDSDGFQDSNVVSIKTKRFLGSLARGGWFPRQFRGFTAENPYDKRHVGSAARVGWLPLSKSDRDYFGEGTGFKRNIQSVKQIQYAAPVNTWGWGRQREKRSNTISY
ncbi:hypothetical protein Fcan01_07851 [Folsomia candida]|uniref:Neuropeptide-like 1 n=1 Tax=Folsomia candida TaxID=158441 RepID=A0A226EM03_FOLCA|nr:hypothetical protein Fcan01_07851 [Folsomia candida]